MGTTILLLALVGLNTISYSLGFLVAHIWFKYIKNTKLFIK